MVYWRDEYGVDGKFVLRSILSFLQDELELTLQPIRQFVSGL